MSVRVRFAPSPTGYLHIGGARTALYNYLFAKGQGGEFILRVEDTDLERSSKEFEEKQIADLRWLGINHVEGPDLGGQYAPYRQSERLDIYKNYAEKLIEKNQAFYCFCTEEELEAHKEECVKTGRPPHYSGLCRNLTEGEIQSKIASGLAPVIRFKAPHKSYLFQDGVRGRVVFPEGMVGDFVIIRSNNLPVYNYCCVIDDMLMKMTHVIRAEEHLPNTLRQLMIYEALGAVAPEFSHVSLLVGSDRQKLSKRHGATSVEMYKDEGFLPEAMKNYLCLLGWSHPEEKDIFFVDDLGSKFSVERFSKSSAMFDLDKLKWVNGQHLKDLESNELLAMIEKIAPAITDTTEGHRIFNSLNSQQKIGFTNLFKEQLQLASDIFPLIAQSFSEDLELFNQAQDDHKKFVTSPLVEAWKKQLHAAHKQLGDNGFVTTEQFEQMMNQVKTETALKGKPLFMGTRLVLTGLEHGPELKNLLPLVPLQVLLKRCAQTPIHNG